MPTHRTNPHGGSTPATDGRRVVVWHASAGLHCYAVDGTPLWQRQLGTFKHRWGYGTSPVLHGNTVLLHSGPGAKVFVAAFDLNSGKTIWKHDEPVQGNGEDNAEGRLMGSWSTPLIVNRNDRPPLVICTMATRVLALDLQNGKPIWTCAGLSCHRGDLAYSSPSIWHGDEQTVCLIQGGYEGPGMAIRLGGSGDVTKTHRLWRHAKRPSNVGSGVVADGYWYLPDMRGFIACIDPSTGERLWSEQAIKGQIWGSIVRSGQHLMVTNQKGVTLVFQPDRRKLSLVARNDLGETTNSTPAIAGGQVFLRTHKHLYCIGDGNAWTWYARGMAHHQLGEYSKAIADYSEALQRDADHFKALMWRGYSKGLLGDHLGAWQDFEAARVLDDKNGSVWFARGRALRHLGEVRRAADSLTKAVACNGKDAEAIAELAYAQAVLGNLAKARQLFLRANKLAPERDYHAWLWAAWTARLDQQGKTRAQPVAVPAFPATVFRPGSWAATLRDAMADKMQPGAWNEHLQRQKFPAADRRHRLCEIAFYSGIGANLANDPARARKRFQDAVVYGSAANWEWWMARRFTGSVVR